MRIEGDRTRTGTACKIKRKPSQKESLLTAQGRKNSEENKPTNKQAKNNNKKTSKNIKRDEHWVCK